LATVANRWRQWKCDLKATYFHLHEKTPEQISENVPENVITSQWVSLVSQWCSEKNKVFDLMYSKYDFIFSLLLSYKKIKNIYFIFWQKMSETNTRNARRKSNPHTSGRKSYARRREEIV
jgi:hypothetical protein